MSISPPMPPAYDPRAVEPTWSARWEAARLFLADPTSPRPHYALCQAPPNVTGVLHLGHATNVTVQDVWARYRRMTGYEVLFLPGTDHAAIATQNVIERQLAAEGTSKEQLGRSAFASRVERWYADVGQIITAQLRELGPSLDWSRARFTMDGQYARAVRAAFVHFYERGWLYRGPRIVNWCPRCQSAISDLELDWRERRDTLYHVRYPLDGGGEVTIATTRPETMLADSGVAVHPQDSRYRHLVGRQAILPLAGRRLPVVADEAVRPEFATGVLKVTPGHDAVDYEIGQRHGLPVLDGLHPDGRVRAPDFPAYDGLPAATARALVVRDLEAGGFLVRTEGYRHEVGHCSRCAEAIEPLVSEQWFMRMGALARRALSVAAEAGVRWHPPRHERVYLAWLDGLKDWCVSRQLWLGHRIPVYWCPNGHHTAALEPPLRCPHCDAAPLAQDPDVLDTWFSSALWPLATLGWPDDTPELRAFYPTDMVCTDQQIIRLWISRMIMCGLELSGAAPFRDVVVHCTVLGADGRRMEKSRPQTAVDPRQLLARYGADALRAWCAQVATSGPEVRFDERRIEGYRRFANKLWNATRLVLGSLAPPPGGAAHGPSGAAHEALPAPPEAMPLSEQDRWLLERLQATVDAVTRGIETFELHLAIEALQQFAWHELCDRYLEAVKPRLRRGDPPVQAVALHALDVLLRLLHPFMPFVSEELWHRLPGQRGFLLHQSWPSPAQPPLGAGPADATSVGHQLTDGLGHIPG
ncbi:MAG TPA: valine--tRNA ligase [Chloroflexota bacterium]|nr:valine--tRNA ligase [Chloroflexota bacterium]